MKHSLNRRQFHHATGAAWGAAALGCGTDQREQRQRSTQSTGGSSAQSGTGGDSGGQQEFPSGGENGGMGGAPLTCGELTPTNIEGPFFLDGSPERRDIRQDSPGPALELTGRVFDENCQRLEGALIDFWQADEDGGYDTSGNEFRGHQFTTADGGYRLSSIVPGRYLNGSQYRPAHIHVKVTSGAQTLTTQLYFPDDPFNEVDPFIDWGLLVRVTEGESGVLRAEFDFYVPA